MTKQLGALNVVTRDLDSVHSTHKVTNNLLLCFLLTFTVPGTQGTLHTGSQNPNAH